MMGRSAYFLPVALLVAGCQVDRFEESFVTLCYCGDICPEFVEECAQELTPLPAGGQGTLWRIFVPDDTAVGKPLTVTTNLGTLSAGADQPQQLGLRSQGAAPVDFVLDVGLVPGVGRLVVSGNNGLEDTAEFRLTRLEPCLRVVSESPVCGGDTADVDDDELESGDYADCVSASSSETTTLHANGGTVQLEVVLPDADLGADPLPQTVEVESTLANLGRPGGTTTASKLTLSVVPGRAVGFLLRQGRQTGIGQLTATLAQQPSTRLEYEIMPAQDELSIALTDPTVYDDGQGYSLELSLTSTALTGPQEVSVEATRGHFNPGAEGPDKFRTTVQVTPCADQPAIVTLTTGTGVGPGTVTATLEDAASDSTTYNVQPVDESLTFEDTPTEMDQLTADGVSVWPFGLLSASTRTTDRMVTVASSLGTLGGATDDGGKALSFSTGPQESADLTLRIGRFVGTEVLTATETGGLVSDTAQFPIGRSYPDFLGIFASPSVLTAGAPLSQVDAYFGRQDEALVSHYSRVDFVACCDDGSPDDPCAYVEVPSSVEATVVAPEQVEVQLGLTPAGVALVNEVGAPPGDNVPVTLYAFTPGPGTNLTMVNCLSLEAGVPNDFAAADTQTFALQRMAP